MKKQLLILTIMLTATIGYSQITFQKIFDGDSSLTFGYDILQTSDGGYILVGSTDSYGVGDRDAYIIKLNSNGDTLWSKTYGDAAIEESGSIVQTKNSCYTMSGVMFSSDTSYNSKLFLLKINNYGNICWMKTFDSLKYPCPGHIQQTNDNGFLISSSIMISNHYSAYIIKTDSLGKQIWNKILTGSSGSETLSVCNFVDESNDYYITGTTTSQLNGDNDIFVTKLSSSGDIIWTKTYGNLNSDNPSSFCKTHDGNFLIIGYTLGCGSNTSGSYIIKINPFGDIIWTKTHMVSSFFGDVVGKGICNRFGEILITGYTPNDNIPERHTFLLKLDSLGNSIWFKSYGFSSSTSSYYYFNGSSIDTCLDGGYIINGTASINGKNGMYLIKTDNNGNSGCNEITLPVIPFSKNTFVSNFNFNISSKINSNNFTPLISSGCHVNTLSSSGIEEPLSDHFYYITIFPNPFSSFTTIQINRDLKDAILIVYNSFGQKIKIIKNIMGQTITLYKDNLQSGLYFMQLIQDNKVIGTEKLVITD